MKLAITVNSIDIALYKTFIIQNDPNNLSQSYIFQSDLGGQET